MAVKLRLRRMGKKRQPIYKVVAADERSPRDGKFIEAIGLYNPLTDPATLNIDEERAIYWLGVGAKPTDTVKNILSKKGILLKQDLIRRGLGEKEIEAQMEEWYKTRPEIKPVKKQEEMKTETAPAEEKVEAEISSSEDSSEVTGAASNEDQQEAEKPTEA